MVIGIKDAVKFFGVGIMICCAVFVCNLFLNYGIDLRAIESLINGEQMKITYDALCMNNKVVCLVTGGCLVLTSIVMLIFYIGLYVQANSHKLGVLKALGYSDLKIALSFVAFGLSVLLGAAIGLGASWIMMPLFYAKQANNSLLPEITLKFHFQLPLLLVLLPSLFFGALSIVIAYAKLKRPVMSLLKGESVNKHKKLKDKDTSFSFLRGMAFSIIGEKKSLAFFVAFGGFCVSAMLQMGASMKDYASDMMGIMMVVIGIILAATALYLALTTVVGANSKSIAMLKVFGYNLKESALAVLGLYHIPAYIGFALGAVYQWGLLNIMVNIVFAEFEGIPTYSFEWANFGICLAVFVVAYELLNLVYAKFIGKTSLKVVMGE